MTPIRPIVIIFERHWDKIPKQVAQSLISNLKQEGYNTFCFEHPHDIPEDQIIPGIKGAIEAQSEMQTTAVDYLKRAGIEQSSDDLQRMLFEKLRMLMWQHVSR